MYSIVLVSVLKINYARCCSVSYYICNVANELYSNLYIVMWAVLSPPQNMGGLFLFLPELMKL